MTSPLLALFTRSLREDTRGRMTYFARGGLAMFTLLLTIGTTFGSQWKGAPGREFFAVVVTLQALCVTIAGLGYFASAVTEEKEDMTLGLLRMTNLNPLSILLGKSTSRLCSALMLLAVTFPFAMLAVTLGGISAQQIVASLLAVGAYTFFLCNLALLASVIARHTPGAATLTTAALAIYFCAGPLVFLARLIATKLGWLAGQPQSAQMLSEKAEWLMNATVIGRLSEALRTGFAGPVAGWQVASNLALGVLCFLAAWAVFGRFCDRALEGAAETNTTRRRFLGLRLRRPPRPWRNAIAWKEFHYACGGRAGLIVRCCGYGLVVVAVLVAFILQGSNVTQFGNVSVMLLPSLASFAFTIEVAVMAARIFGNERREQTLSTLASLPLPMARIVRHKALGCLLAAWPGLIVSSLASLSYFQMARGQPFLLLSIVSQTVTQWCDLFFLASLIALLSLFMLRGALPLGFLISIAISTILQMVVVGLTFATGMFAGGSMMTFTLFVPLLNSTIYLVAGVILYRRSIARLEIVAGES